MAQTLSGGRRSYYSAVLLAAGMASPLAAQTVPGVTGAADPAATPVPIHNPAATEAALPVTADGTVTFTPADFARFTPRTALEMVRQIPDFTISEGDGDRGLGQASTNVLINGERVSGKSNDVLSALDSIAASAVQRIEVSDGARLNIPGLTGRVANVIITSQGWAVQYRWDAQFRRNIPDQLLTAAISASGRLGGSDVTISLSNNDGRRRGGVGPEFVTDADGTLLLTRDERAVFVVDEPRLAGTLRRGFGNGSVLNLNLTGSMFLFDANIAGVVTDATSGALSDELFVQTEDERFFEGGGDYSFALGGGQLKIIGLQSYEHSPNQSVFTVRSRAPGSVTTGSRYAQTADEGETILRAEYGWRAGGDWQIAVEGAYNFLDISANFAALTADGSFAPIALPNAVTFVDEWRTEALLTRGWTLGPGLSLQTIIGGEYSRLRQTGPAGLSRQFFRPKGSAALAWTVSPRLTINAQVARQVGQLSFYDFADSIDLQNGSNNAGNAQLVPEQTWRFEGEAIRTLGAAGSITIGGYGELITDIVDQIPIGPTGEGVGNLPRARRWGLEVSSTILFDTLGWRGARLNATGEFRASSVRDPVTGINRRISEDLVRRWTLDFRHDVHGTQLAWGASASEETFGHSFRLNETRRSTLSQPVAMIYAEHKDVLGMTVRLSLRNLLDTRDDIRRDVYVARRDGPVDFRERQLRRIYPILMLSISGGF